MARVTVEDCVTIIPNRFDLVVLAAERARQIISGAPLTVERENDKNPVVSLREVAEKSVDPQALRDSMVKHYRSNVELDPSEKEMADFLAGEQEIADEFLADDFVGLETPTSEVEVEVEDEQTVEGEETYNPDTEG